MPDIVILPGQSELLACKASNILYCAGVGAGKTIGGALWTMTQLINFPEVVGLVGAPSYNQLARVSLPTLLRLLGDCSIEYVYGKRPPDLWGAGRYPENERILSVRVPGTARPAQALCYTMDDADALRGISVGYAWIDEATAISVDSYNVVQSRMRGQPEGTQYRTLLTTTPSGFNWIYRKFIAEPIPDSAIIRASTTANHFLPAGFVDNLRAQFTESYAKQEIDGQFLNLTAGQAYYAFNRAKHVTAISVDPLQPLFYSMDWNVSPLCAVYGMFDKSSAQFAGEVYIQGSGRTSDAAEEFNRRFTEHKNRQLIIYGDMSGANRDTRNDSTDYDILERVFKAAGWAVEIRRNYSNPPFIESVEAVNASFEHNKVTVDPSCKRLITDLEQVAWQSGTKVLDKSNKELTHMSDAARYFLFKEFSARQKAGTSDILN